MLLKAVADILRSHDLLTDEDLKMFDAYQQTEPLTLRAMTRTAELYSQAATKLGLDVPIEGLAK